MSILLGNIPSPSSPFLAPDGTVTEVWRAFLNTLFVRSGGGSGFDLTALTKQVIANTAAALRDDMEINAAVALPPKPIALDFGQVPIYRPAPMDASHSMVYAPPGPYALVSQVAGYAPVQSVAGRTGNVVLGVGDVSGVAPLASPAFSGSPQVPLASAHNNTTLAASCSYVQQELAVPPSIGATTPGPAIFTTLKANASAALSYTNVSGQSIPSGVATTVTGWTVAFDRNGNFNASTGTFTAPTTGTYLISGQLLVNIGAASVNNSLAAYVIANAATVSSVSSPVYNASQSLGLLPFGIAVQLAAGQTAIVQVIQATGSAKTLNIGAGANALSIVQIP